jgi:D-alanyl-D-alanine carboxypeptidase
MAYPLLREIVKTVKYGPFENTNRLLEDGFEGIKTGITDSAGPCLAASYKDYIIVMLKSKSMNDRWIEVKKLVKWIIKKN